ncbi:MAG: thiamine pyrophosphate-dependent enzyme [Spirochaetales bacterium]|uniref:Indolepyruvate oxidoreductase subunit IorA n=1 Tax=Candidatus Thalassospirochaeta sargassi TaxID=3119039 RepID=A0AAJ1IE13_9SPIO|nr:thiamine pyrophosphate-dependent enzyme [Spirochaetales bacterium]
MGELVLLGDEALALGAIDAGISSAYGYPGTPSSEIMEYVLKYSETNDGIFASWSSNEKTAYEEALGASFVGRRVLVTMKHVGLNVAADPFMNSALLDIKGGFVIAVADDPGMHSSQGEQDSRYFAAFARTMCFEPRNQQECYEMTREAFEVSERFHIPVMIRLVTRLAHSRAVVNTAPVKPQNPMEKTDNTKGWMLLPALARKNWASLLERQSSFLEYTTASEYNPLTINSDFTEFGVITSGLGKNYYDEAKQELPELPSHLHISAYPVPVDKVRELAENVKKIIVIEEGCTFIEDYLRGYLPQAIEISGKQDGEVPLTGELNPDNIRKSLGLAAKDGHATDMDIPGRPPQLCKGCPHADTYAALNEAREAFDNSIVTSDIGCYSLGALPPHNAIETIICMGASIGTAKGAAEAGFKPVVSVIGDSTFLHSGISPLIDAVSCNTPMTVVILDNGTVAMTGGQTTIMPSSRLKTLIEGIGIEAGHIKTIIPLKKHHAENVEIFKTEMNYQGISVIIALRECLETAKKKKSGGSK